MPMGVSEETTVVADSSKLGRRSLFRIGPIEKVHRLITDADAPKQFIDALRRKHVDVVVV
jgi:DeoR/GlpR family transcriptional regulator of sugar metabolism